MFAQFKREERRGDKRPFPQFSFLLPWLTGQMHCVEYNEVPVVPASKENKDFGRRRRRKNARENDENAIFFGKPERTADLEFAYIRTRSKDEGRVRPKSIFPLVGPARMKGKFELMPSRPFSCSKGGVAAAVADLNCKQAMLVAKRTHGES